MKRRSAKAVRIPSARSDDQPATRKMLGLARRELIQRMDAGFHRMEARFADFEARFSNLEASNARMELLLEEQNHNNRYVLEMLQGLYQRQSRLEDRMDARGL